MARGTPARSRARCVPLRAAAQGHQMQPCLLVRATEAWTHWVTEQSGGKRGDAVDQVNMPRGAKKRRGVLESVQGRKEKEDTTWSWAVSKTQLMCHESTKWIEVFEKSTLKICFNATLRNQRSQWKREATVKIPSYPYLVKSKNKNIFIFHNWIPLPWFRNIRVMGSLPLPFDSLALTANLHLPITVRAAWLFTSSEYCFSAFWSGVRFRVWHHL